MKDKNDGLRKLLKKYEAAAAHHRKTADGLDAHSKILRDTLASLEALEPVK